MARLLKRSTGRPHKQLSVVQSGFPHAVDDVGGPENLPTSHQQHPTNHIGYVQSIKRCIYYVVVLCMNTAVHAPNFIIQPRAMGLVLRMQFNMNTCGMCHCQAVQTSAVLSSALSMTPTWCLLKLQHQWSCLFVHVYQPGRLPAARPSDHAKHSPSGCRPIRAMKRKMP